MKKVILGRCFECGRYLKLEKNKDCPRCGIKCLEDKQGLHFRIAKQFIVLRKYIDDLEAQIVAGEE